MRFVNEYRDPALVNALSARIRGLATRPWNIMEVCGGQTHTILRYDLPSLLPPDVHLLHGPGCPVCITPESVLDHAIHIASQPGTVLCTFGDMLRVPGSRMTLARARASGARVSVVYSPLDAVALAKNNPDCQVVFLGIGFETTAPVHAAAVTAAERLGLTNFSVLLSLALVPPALHSILQSPESTIHAVLAAGHVCAITGVQQYEPIAREYRVPVIVTGFEPADILQGVLMAVEQLENGQSKVDIQYDRAVRPRGNENAQAVLTEVFELAGREWRGLGILPGSGYRLRDKYRRFDAERRFPLMINKSAVVAGNCVCQAGKVMRGVLRPDACPEFNIRCRPESPLGAPMVSAEGACAAYYLYARHIA